MGFVKNFLNIAKIKSSEKQYSNMQSVFQTNLEGVKEATRSVNINRFFSASMKPVEAARYCVTTYEKGRPFYVLTYVNGGTGKSTKQTKEVTEAVLSELKAYLGAKGGANEKKAYYNAAAAVLSEINEAIGSNTLIGFVCDRNAADNYVGFEYSVNTPVSVLNDSWSSVRTTVERLDILNKVLGEKKKIVPNKILGLICAQHKPFGTIYWKIIKHQMQYEDPIDENVFKYIEEFSEFREVLQNGDNINGLNFGKQVQFWAINAALLLGEGYIDELRTSSGWLGEDAMEEKAKYLKEVMEQKNISSMITPKMKQELEQKKMLQAQRAAAMAPLQAEIADLKAQIQMIRNGPNAYELYNQRRVQALEKQCRELELQLKNIG